MLNMKNVPGGIIGGLDEEMLDFVTRESSERFVNELSSSFLQELENIDRMDKFLTEEAEILLTDLENSRKSSSTEKQTKNEMQCKSGLFFITNGSR